MSTSIEKTPVADSAPLTGKRSTSASSGDKKLTGTLIWAAKDPWSKPSGGADKDSKPTKKSSKRPRSSKPEKSEKADKATQKMYQAKLMLEENQDEKSVLVKIGQRTSIRQIINYAMDKIKAGWKVTFNAFQLEMTKALQATEIIKTRLSFLHQENKLISHTMPAREVKEGGNEFSRIRSGISITLSKNQFETIDPVGYQKPKPRQFLQPPPARGYKKPEEKEISSEHGDDLRKRRDSAKGKGRAKTIRPRRTSLDKDEDLDRKKSAPKKNGEEKKIGKKGKQAYKPKNSSPRSISDERDRYGGYYNRPRYEDEEEDDRYVPFSKNRGTSKKTFDSDYDHDPRGYGPPPSRGGPPPSRGGPRGYYARGGSSLEHFRGPPPGYHMRGPPPGYYDRPSTTGYPKRKDFEKPERPGFYSGNRQFRMDKIRDQPLEGKNYPEDKLKRDNRNRPQK